MFSGLTNQMSSLLSTVKGGSTDQEGVAAASEAAAAGDGVPAEEPVAAAPVDASGATETGELGGEDKQR